MNFKASCGSSKKGFCLFSPYWFTWAPYKQRECKVVSEESVTCLLADWSIDIFHIHESEVLVCHFEMFAVGVRCVLFPSTREANSYFED